MFKFNVIILQFIFYKYSWSTLLYSKMPMQILVHNSLEKHNAFFVMLQKNTH